MASIYSKNNMLYITWYDFKTGKRRNRSLKLPDTPRNRVKAEQTKKQFEEALENEKDEFKGLGIKRNTIKRAFNHFLENNSHKRPKTIKDYNRFFNLFTKTFDPQDPCTIINKLSIEHWLNQIRKLTYKNKDKPLKKNTIFGYYKQLNHFLNFLFEYNYIPMFMINRDVKPKSEQVEKIIFSKPDLLKIFDGLANKNAEFRCAIYVLFYTGLRPSDILSFEKSKIDLHERTIRYFSQKRKIHREIAFHPELVPVFQERIESGSKIIPYASSENLGKALKRYLIDLQLDHKKYTQYTFRKTFLTFARSSGIRDEVVRELVGHAQESVGNIHYNAISIDDMKKELELLPTIDSIRNELKSSEKASSSSIDYFYKLS